MATAVRPTAIAGVSAGGETEIMTVFPSIAAGGAGQALGSLYDSIPVSVCGLKLSRVLFCLPTAPIGALIYLLYKVGGERYMLTNRSVQRWTAAGSVRLASVPLAEIEDVVIEERPGQAFYKAGDLLLLGKGSSRLMVLAGVPYPAVFRETILEARDSAQQVRESLERIKARG